MNAPADPYLARVTSAEWPRCRLERVDNGAAVEAVASSVLQDLWIVLRPGDLVTVEVAEPFPIVTYRWWRARVKALGPRGHAAHIDPPPSGAQRDPFMRLHDPALAVSVDDIVYCSRTAVVDVERGGDSPSLDRFAEAYARERDGALGEDAALRLPGEEVVIDADLVHRLLNDQFPQWADLPLQEVDSWENAMFRLGDDLAVRLTRGRWALGQLDTEHRWLPRLAPHLPLPVPTPIAHGRAGFGYPWRWSITTWVEGERATPDRLDSQSDAARDLANFLAHLQAIDATGGPVVGSRAPYWFGWQPFDVVEPRVRRRLQRAEASPDRDILMKAWREAVNAPKYDSKPVWLHGDLHPTNVVARDGRLSGVIDFGCVSTGDPAYDYAGAWRLLTADGRAEFRDVLEIDDATWTRARGWALLTAADQVVADERQPS